MVLNWDFPYGSLPTTAMGLTPNSPLAPSLRMSFSSPTSVFSRISFASYDFVLVRNPPGRCHSTATTTGQRLAPNPAMIWPRFGRLMPSLRQSYQVISFGIHILALHSLVGLHKCQYGNATEAALAYLRFLVKSAFANR